ncbi:MAG: hypothetical protein WCP34_16165 [Pseudomonadota bacterium]
MTGWANIERYLEATLGERPVLHSMPTEQTRRLPLLLRSRYEMATTTVLGRVLTLARDQAPEGASPAEYAGHLNMLQEVFGPDVTLVLQALAGARRARLVQAGIPFILPERQLFLPMLATDLRERNPRVRKARIGALTLTAQLVLLRHLLGYETVGRSLRALAVDLGYSAMTLSNVADELVASQLCRVEISGRRRMLEFNGAKPELWERSQNLLRSPARWTRWIRLPTPAVPKDWCLAGVSALAQMTLLADDLHPTYALRDRTLAQLTAQGTVVEVQDAEEATARIEGWGYDPRLLTREPTIDRLSLYLSQRGTTDERIAKAIRQTLESIPW